MIAGVESVDALAYRRIVRASVKGADRLGIVQVSQHPARPALVVMVDSSLRDASAQVLDGVRSLFDLAADPQLIASTLGELAKPEPGLRVPGAFDGFELAVRAILGQQVTVKAAHTLAGRVAARFGTPITDRHPDLRHAFPLAATIAASDPETLMTLGIVSQRARAIVELARAVAERRLILTPDQDISTQIDTMLALPGVGDWTAQYIAMRALRWPDAFLASDLIVMRALGVSTPAQARKLAVRWSPWRAYAVMQLWRSWQRLKSKRP